MSLAVALLLGVLTAQPDGGLALRGGEPAPAGRVLEVSLDGVTVGSTVASPVIVGWHRVRSVEGPLAGEAAAFEEVADDAWRAMSRLDRGDAQAAEPVFERLQDLYRGRSGPTAAAVFEGLLRCRLRRNAQTLAVDAWLEWRRARSAADGAQWYRGNRDAEGIGGIVFDEETGLVPDLPPLWLDVPAVRVFAEAPERTESVNERDRQLAALYRLSLIHI